MIIGIILLLNAVELLLTKEDDVLLVKEEDSVVITCPHQSSMAMHFSWYKHKDGRKPELISTIYKYDNQATYYSEFKASGRFNMRNGDGKTHLIISNVQLLDSATYYCGSAHSNIVEFGQGTYLLVKASQVCGQTILQKPALPSVDPGNSVTLQCSVLTKSCAGEHSVYWFRQNSEESHRGMIYSDGDRSVQCYKDSETGSPTQSCFYSLYMKNLSSSDAGTYYCAVAMCGEILFGNGTSIRINHKGEDCPTHLNILVILSLLRTLVLMCSVVITIWFVNQQREVKRSDSVYISEKSRKEGYSTRQTFY